MKLELVLKKELLQSGCELAPEDATQRGDGHEESSRGGDPSGTVGCKTTSRNNVMDVWMMLKVLSPGVEHAKKPDVCSQMLGVTSELEQRRCTARKNCCRTSNKRRGDFAPILTPSSFQGGDAASTSNSRPITAPVSSDALR